MNIRFFPNMVPEQNVVCNTQTPNLIPVIMSMLCCERPSGKEVQVENPRSRVYTGGTDWNWFTATTSQSDVFKLSVLVFA